MSGASTVGCTLGVKEGRIDEGTGVTDGSPVLVGPTEGKGVIDGAGVVVGCHVGVTVGTCVGENDLPLERVSVGWCVGKEKRWPATRVRESRLKHRSVDNIRLEFTRPIIIIIMQPPKEPPIFKAARTESAYQLVGQNWRWTGEEKKQFFGPPSLPSQKGKEKVIFY